MIQDLKVAIIDDDKLSTLNWKILLNFINEDVLLFSTEQWHVFVNQHTNADADQVFAVVIGKLMALAFNDSANEELVKSIHEHYPQMPVLLNCNQDFIQNKIPETSQPWLIQLSDNIEYKTLLQHFDYARQLHGIELKQSKSKIISEHGTPLFRTLVGSSDAITQVKDLMHKVASKKVNVLLFGESGTGKEIVARNIHYYSGRGEEPFIIVNCAAQGEQFEVAFFGCVSGYKNSQEVSVGYLEKADGGTLFLDKIAEIPLDLQARLVSFLEEKAFQRLGDNKLRKVDLRIVVATNADLKQKVDVGEFREDLYYLLNVLPISLPALREHAEDIPDLLKELIIRLEHEGQQAIRLNSSAIDALKLYSWPGNVRELTNLIERLSVIHEGKIIGLNELPPEYRQNIESNKSKEQGLSGQSIDADTAADSQFNAKPASTLEEKLYLKIVTPLTVSNLEQYLKSFEKEIIETAIEDSAGVLSFAAERLEIEEESLQLKLQAFSIKLD